MTPPGHEAPDGWVSLGSGMWAVPTVRDGFVPVASRAGYIHGVLRATELHVPGETASDEEWRRWAAAALERVAWLREAVTL